MKHIVTGSLILLFVMFIAGCGGNTDLPKTDTGDIPEWFINTPTQPDYILVPRTATSRDMQMAIDKATMEGRTEAARIVESKIEGLQKRFDEEVGVLENSTLLQQYTSAQKNVVSATLNGSQVRQKHIVQDGNTWRAYVLVEYPIGAANSAFLNQIKSQEELYTRFRASETFKELDEEVRKYEESKMK